MPVAPSYNEQRYFLAKNAQRRQELRAKLDAAAKHLQERADIASALSVDDHEIVERIHALGFNGDSARVFDLLPLVHVSWADGKVQGNERAAILAILEQRGIEPDSDASLLIESLLEQRPSETFLGESLAVLKALVGDRGDQGAGIVDLCAQVADASGGLLGLGSRTSAQERDLIAQVAGALGQTAEARFYERLGR